MLISWAHLLMLLDCSQVHNGLHLNLYLYLQRKVATIGVSHIVLQKALKKKL